MDARPASDAGARREGRLANVSAVVLARPGDDAAAAACRAGLARICEEVLVLQVGRDESPLAVLVAALEASRAERVLLVDPAGGAPAERVLALVAWPERAVVHPAGTWSEAICVREVVLPVARARLAAGDRQVADLAERVDVEEMIPVGR